MAWCERFSAGRSRWNQACYGCQISQIRRKQIVRLSLSLFPRIRTENSELKHTQTNRVVHVVGPDFRQESKDNRSGLETLARAYTNILSETARSQVSSLRLLPVSGGVFAAHFRNDIHFMTWHALVQGFKNLSKEEQESILKMDSLKMCIFMEKELNDFERAREWIALSHGSSSKF